MTAVSLVAMYQSGAITADHLVVRSLLLVDPADPALALNPLPHEILMRAIEFAREYKPDAMATNYGSVPDPDQVDAAKKWIEATLRSEPVASGIAERFARRHRIDYVEAPLCNRSVLHKQSAGRFSPPAIVDKLRTL